MSLKYINCSLVVAVLSICSFLNVGVSYADSPVDVNKVGQGFVWSKDKGLIGLNSVQENAGSKATTINNNGIIGGVAYHGFDPVSPFRTDAVYWDINRNVIPLGNLTDGYYSHVQVSR